MKTFKVFWVFAVDAENEWEALDRVKAEPKKYFKSAFIPKDKPDKGWWGALKEQLGG